MSPSPLERQSSARRAGGLRHSIFHWFDSRYKLQGLIDFIRHKEVPVTRMSIWYYFGGMALFLLSVQLVTGILLLMYYVPSTDGAYESVNYIMAKVSFGWLVRSLHVWSANLLILVVMIHMASVFFMRAYRNPRECTWMTGCALLGLCLAFGFSGYLLPWNELAFFATKVGTDIVGEVPLVGGALLEIVRGGEDVTEATLRRFFGLHVAILPGITILVLGLHLLAIQRQGMSKPAMRRTASGGIRTMPFFPHFILRDLLLWFIFLNVLAVLAVFFPAPLGLKADPFAPAPAGIKPEWYFLAQFQTLKWLPATIGPISGELVGILSMSLVGLIIFVLPFIDRTKEGGPRRVWLDVVGVAVILYLILMTVLGHVLH